MHMATMFWLAIGIAICTIPEAERGWLWPGIYLMLSIFGWLVALFYGMAHGFYM